MFFDLTLIACLFFYLGITLIWCFGLGYALLVICWFDWFGFDWFGCCVILWLFGVTIYLQFWFDVWVNFGVGYIFELGGFVHWFCVLILFNCCLLAFVWFWLMYSVTFVLVVYLVDELWVLCLLLRFVGYGNFNLAICFGLFFVGFWFVRCFVLCWFVLFVSVLWFLFYFMLFNWFKLVLCFALCVMLVWFCLVVGLRFCLLFVFLDCLLLFIVWIAKFDLLLGRTFVFAF